MTARAAFWAFLLLLAWLQRCDASPQEEESVTFRVPITVAPNGDTVGAAPIDMPDRDVVVTAWLWQLLDEDDEEVRGEELLMHHSNVHAYSRREPMFQAMMIIGATNHYGRRMELPAPFGIFHGKSEPRWGICHHVESHSEGTRHVVQQLTLWFHERTSEDVRIVQEKLGHPRAHAFIGVDRAYERNTWLGKLPNQPGKIVAFGYHIHRGVMQMQLQDSLSGDDMWSYDVPYEIDDVRDVLQTPEHFLDEPIQVQTGQFLYLNVLVNRTDVPPDDTTGPMQNLVIYMQYDDQEYIPPMYYHLNPDKVPCYPRLLGVARASTFTQCRAFDLNDLQSTTGRYPIARVLPNPKHQACTTTDSASCWLSQPH